MKLKCIGGPADDKWFELPCKIRLYDAVRIPSYQFEPISVSNLGAIEETIVNYNIYIIECFNFSKDDIYYFLRHEKLTNKEAVLHQFSKKCLQNYK